MIIDTAYGYGDADVHIGNFFRKPAGATLLPHALIHTKFGHSRHGPPPTERLSLEALKEQWKESCASLPRIDGIYYHLPSSIPEDLAMETLRDKAVADELIRLREEGIMGLTSIGASISNAKVLARAHEEGILLHLDMLQVPQWMAREESALLQALHDQGKAIAVNSPVRFFAKGNEPPKKAFEDCYTELWNMPYVSAVLTGTRYHLVETLTYCGR